ncbi:MAG: nodulation protein NfeD [Acidobacteriota bacterium]
MTHLRNRRRAARAVFARVAVVAGGLVLLPALLASAPTPVREVRIVRLSSLIHPVAAQYLVEAIEDADRYHAAALVLELDTPGGSLESTREMFTAMLGAKTPIVVWVAPNGARAASAGFFLLQAADLAAMAPGTNTGAAHPVGGQGETIEGVLGEKIEQDAAATIRGLAARNHRDVKVAEEAVVNSRSFTADEALKVGLIDLIAPDRDSLIQQLEGRAITKSDGQVEKLAVQSASVREIEMNGGQRLLAAICHPNIAYLLMTLGLLGLYFELSHPGAVLPGVVGGIALILGLYALSVLQVNYAGLALILLGVTFFLAEIKVTSYGLLTVGGVVSLVLGSLMLFRSAEPALRVGRDVIGAVVLFSVLVVGFLLTMAIRAKRQPVRTGAEGLLIETGTARTDLAPRGKVFVHGELWDALAEQPIHAGDAVRILAVEGNLLRVAPRQAPNQV